MIKKNYIQDDPKRERPPRILSSCSSSSSSSSFDASYPEVMCCQCVSPSTGNIGQFNFSQKFQGEPIQKRTSSYSSSSSSSTLANHKVTWVLIFCFSYRGILSLFIWRHCRNSINNFWLNDQYKRFIFRKRSNLSCWTEKDKQSFICQWKRFLINWRHLPESFHRQIILNIIIIMSMITKSCTKFMTILIWLPVPQLLRFSLDVLKAHNDLRALHEVEPMKMSETVNSRPVIYIVTCFSTKKACLLMQTT